MPTTCYAIKDWEKFETAETRKLKQLDWWPKRNKHDGLGFRRMAAQRNNVQLYCAWTLICDIASRTEKENRGRLVRDGRSLTPADLALMTGFSEDIFDAAFRFFADPKQGWLEVVEMGQAQKTGESPGTPADHPGTAGDHPATLGESPAAGVNLQKPQQNGKSPGTPGESPGTPGDPPATAGDPPAEGKGREGNGIEGREGNGAVAPVRDEPELKIASGLRTAEFQNEWELWKTFRKTNFKKPKNWEAFLQEQLNWLAQFPPAVACKILNESRRNCWQGLFEPKNLPRKAESNQRPEPMKDLPML